jgi:opacity protein-like surface antigen
MRFAPTLLSFAAVLSVALAAGAARADDCPDGDWFCEPAGPSEPPPGPAPESHPGERSERMRLEPPAFHRPRRIVFEPRPPARRHSRRHHRVFHPWAFDAHVFGALLGDGRDANQDVSMGGLGVGLRYRVLPEFAVGGDIELGFGSDYNGDDRQESALLLHAIGTVNPRSVVRLFFLGGFGLSTAHVTSSSGDSSPLWPSRDERYSYFGLDLGAGVEVGLSPRTAIHAELLGFVRDRTDDDRHSQPEFVDPETGRTTNSSGGGLLRLGATFYW